LFVEVFSYPDEVPDVAVELAKLDCSDTADFELVELAC
jgi:hypothetical protein